MKPLRKVFLFVGAIGLAGACSAKIQGFEFFDSSNVRYNSKQLETKPYLVLVETDSAENAAYKAQWQTLENISGEELNAIFVSANLTGEDTSGYHTTKETARQIAGKRNGFQVQIISPSGEVLEKSQKELSAQEISEVILGQKQ